MMRFRRKVELRLRVRGWVSGGLGGGVRGCVPVEALFEEVALECGRVAAVDEGSVCEEPGLDFL